METSTGSGSRITSPKTTRKPCGWAQVCGTPEMNQGFSDMFDIELLEEHLPQVSRSRMEELIGIFIRATELEIQFWDMGMSDNKV